MVGAEEAAEAGTYFTGERVTGDGMRSAALQHLQSRSEEETKLPKVPIGFVLNVRYLTFVTQSHADEGWEGVMMQQSSSLGLTFAGEGWRGEPRAWEVR